MNNDKVNFQTTKDGIRVFINDRDLIDTLSDYEKPFAAKESPSPETGDYAPIERERFLSRSFDTESDDDLLLYRCRSCGEDGCWPMVVKIKYTDTQVIWSDFQQPHRDITSHNFWDYSQFGPFYFNAKDYYAQLSSLG